MRYSIVRVTLVWLAALLPLAVMAQTSFPGSGGKWRHYASPNFELFSANPEKMSRELLHELETLRAFFLESFKLTERRRLEVSVYYFRTDRDFRGYLPESFGGNRNIGGFYSEGVDRAVICLFPTDDRIGNRQVIYHEYIHHLFRATENEPPPWLNEGTAELFATVTPTGDGKLMEFGHPPLGRLIDAQSQALMPLERLFGVEAGSSVFSNDGHAGLFYAQSWLLMHYLYFGDSKIPTTKRSLFLNLVLTNRVKTPVQLQAAFQDVFGLDFAAMKQRLERYLRSGKYFSGKIPLPPIPAAATYAAREVPPAELGVRLAELAVRVNRAPSAKLALLHAVDRDPADARPLEALGADALRDRDELVARERWGRAVDAGTRNASIFRELGLMEGRAVFSRFDPYYRLPADKAARLRDYLGRSIQYNPEQSAAYEMLAWVEAFAPEPSIGSITLIQKKYPSLTRRERTALALAFVRVRLDRGDEALEMLAGLETMQPDDWETQAIEALRAHIEKRPGTHEAVRPTSSAAEAARVRPPAPRLQPGH